MKTKLLLLYIAGLLAVCPMGGNLMAQTATQPDVLKNDTVSHKLIHRLGLDVRPSYVTPTNDFFDGDNMHQQRIRQALSVHLKYAFQFDKNSSLGRLYPHAYQGIGVSYNTFFCPSELGNPIAVYAFQGSRIAQLSPRLSFDYEWNFGASFGWKKYDRTYNPQNEVIGSKINAYINLGFFLNWQLNSQWSLTAGMDFTHYSNGNTHYPNSGVNPIGGRVGIVRTFGDRATTVQGFKSLSIKPYISYDLVVYGATRKRGFVDGYDVCLVPGSFGIVGLNFNPMYNFNKYFRAGVSVDAQYDESANIKDYRVEESSSSDVKFHRPPFHKQFAVGLCNAGNGIQYVRQALATTDDMITIECVVLFLRCFFRSSGKFQGRLDTLQQGSVVPRFGNKVKSSCLHSLHGKLDTPPSGHQYHRSVGTEHFHLFEQSQTFFTCR